MSGPSKGSTSAVRDEGAAELDLEPIRKRVEGMRLSGLMDWDGDSGFPCSDAYRVIEEDVPALLAEIERLRTDQGQRIEGWAFSWDADCSCSAAAAWIVNTACGHDGGVWGERCTLIIRRTPPDSKESS